MSLRFSRTYKRLSGDALSSLHNAMDEIMSAPDIGQEKKGDLKGVYVYKFKTGRNEYLLGYTFNSTRKIIRWEAVGPHENFYRSLKK